MHGVVVGWKVEALHFQVKWKPLSAMDRDLTRNESNGEGSSWTSNAGILVAVWLTALVFFLFLPFLVNKKLRKVCMRRIKERRWNVEVDSELDASTFYLVALARYEAAQ